MAPLSPFDPAHRMRAALRGGQVSAAELLELHVRRIEALDGPLNAVVTRDFERARRAAAAADARRGRGAPRDGGAALLGLPLTVKDSIDVAGVRCTGGALRHAERVAPADAPAVARLRAAGAVVMGKTNLSPWTCGWHAENAVFGRTSNPWDLERTPGGSSGGAAAAVAAGLTPLELGSDAGGSIRVPAAFCGVYGHAPSYSAVPRSGHLPGGPLPNPAAAVFVQGPLARSAEDLELALDVLAGPDAGEAVAWRLALPPPRHARLGAFRVAVLRPLPQAPLDAAVGAALADTAAALARAGARVGEVALEAILGVPHAFYQLFWTLVWPVWLQAAAPDPVADAADRRRLVEAKRAESAGSGFEYARGLTGDGTAFLDAHAARERYRAAFRRFFADWDVLLAPVAPVLAPLHAAARTADLHAYPVLATVTGQPATAFPAGVAPGGLPVGLQAIGPYLEDRTPLRFAALLADLRGGFRPPPGFAAARPGPTAPAALPAEARP
jgi:amidase